MNGTVAGAPVSFGVFELTPDGAETISPDALLEVLLDAGYSGIDLGPAGFLGEDDELRARLDRFGLGLAGGWVQLPFSDDEAFQAAVPTLDAALRQFSAAAEGRSGLLPLPTLADDGSEARKGAPGRGASIDPIRDDAWHRLAANVARAADMVRRAGFEPTFHHHAGTFVESPEEIDRFLADVDVDLTLDTGHLFVAGGDPQDAVMRWGDRINHLHLKDVDLSVLQRVLAAGGGMREVWSSGAFVALGAGDVALAPVMDAMEKRGYDGWVLVEQDVLCGPDTALDDFIRDRSDAQRINREALRPWL